MSSLSFGVLSRTSFEQILNNLFTSPPDQLPLPPPSEAPLGLSLPRPPVLVNPESNPPPLLETTHRERCKATTLESSQCRNWAKSTLSYCYTHRGLSSTKNSDCPICLEKFSEPTEIFLLACAHQLHKECMSHLRTDTCPVCRSRLTNLPKDLNTQIHTRKLQDTTERNQEELQDALNRLGNGINIFFNPFLMSSREEDRPTGPQIVWPALMSYPASISITDIFEDFIVRQNAGSSRPE